MEPIGDPESVAKYLYGVMKKHFQQEFSALRNLGLGLTQTQETLCLEAARLHCEEMAKTPIFSGKQFLEAAERQKHDHAHGIILRRPELGEAMAAFAVARNEMRSRLS